MFAWTNSFSRSFRTTFFGWVHSEVPEVMPKVWFPKVPFVVTATTWTSVDWFWVSLKITVPSPQPVFPAASAEPAANRERAATITNSFFISTSLAEWN